MTRHRQKILLLVSLSAILLVLAGQALSQSPARIAQIPGIQAGPCNPGPEEKPWLNKSQTPECRALEAIAAMTPEERAAEMGGITGQGRNQRLGLIAGGGSDGPNGIGTMVNAAPYTAPNAAGNTGAGRGAQGRGANVTAFANAVTLAATWDRDLARQFGKALGEEYVAKGMNSTLGPTINIMRTWHWGRNGETFSEDPFLTGELAVAEITALKEQKVLTVLKHYAGNNQENTRIGMRPDNAGIDERITDKALHEIYLPAFKASVERAHTGGIMCSYNQINGKFSCNNPELLGYLRQWGFDGFIAPDAAFALRDPLTAALAGVTRGVNGAQNLVQQDKLSQAQADRMLYYNILPYFRLGIYDSPAPGNPAAEVSTPDHVMVARTVAEEGAVLLKNRRAALPIDAKVKTIAVIGDDAGPHVTAVENGSGHVNVTKMNVPLEAITARAGSTIKVVYERGTAGIGALPPIPANVLKPASGQGEGFLASYFTSMSATGIPVVTRVEAAVGTSQPPPELTPAPAGRGATPGENPPAPPAGTTAPPAAAPPNAAGAGQPGRGTADAGGPGGAGGGRGGRGGGRGGPSFSATWTATLNPPTTGPYTFSLTGSGTAQLYVDGVSVATIMRADFGQTVQGVIQLKTGRPVPIAVKFNNASAVMGGTVQLGWQPPDPQMVSKAVAAAKGADVAIVFAGEQLGEGQDKVSLPLPGDQNSLIDAVASANPRTIVVLHTSNPVSMPWLDKAAAVIEAFYPGQESGSSIARVLFGDVNPSGKLAMTFPANEHQGPGSTFLEYPGDGMTVNFDEGVMVGYRFYDQYNQTPLFPFGFGLSYTTFKYSDLQVEHTSGEQATVKVKVTNTGTREGAEVAQLYLGFPAAAEEPPKQLKGFEKLRLKPGESKVATMKLDAESLAAWDNDTSRFKVFPGAYSVMVGGSSRDIAVRGSFTIAGK
jgi:beta-glucosidase